MNEILEIYCQNVGIHNCIKHAHCMPCRNDPSEGCHAFDLCANRWVDPSVTCKQKFNEDTLEIACEIQKGDVLLIILLLFSAYMLCLLFVSCMIQLKRSAYYVCYIITIPTVAVLMIYYSNSLEVSDDNFYFVIAQTYYVINIVIIFIYTIVSFADTVYICFVIIFRCKKIMQKRIIVQTEYTLEFQDL